MSTKKGSSQITPLTNWWTMIGYQFCFHLSCNFRITARKKETSLAGKTQSSTHFLNYWYEVNFCGAICQQFVVGAMSGKCWLRVSIMLQNQFHVTFFIFEPFMFMCAAQTHELSQIAFARELLYAFDIGPHWAMIPILHHQNIWVDTLGWSLS